jgi:hypothetical protein
LKKYLSIIFRIWHAISWLLEGLLWRIIKPLFSISVRKNKTADFVIGITTFEARFENCFKPLLAKLSHLFPECRIIVVANGHYIQETQIEYINRIEEFCRGFKNVELRTYVDPEGLSFLWNTIIRHSSSSRALILNDDLKVKAGFRKFIFNSGILGNQIAVINSSWSHFLISKEIVETVGWFDEGFREIGGEDDDYAARLAIADVIIDKYKTSLIGSKNRRKLNSGKINSYGKDMEKERGGYSTINTEYLESKWIMSDEYFEGAIFVPDRKPKFWKLKNIAE